MRYVLTFGTLGALLAWQAAGLAARAGPAGWTLAAIETYLVATFWTLAGAYLLRSLGFAVGRRFRQRWLVWLLWPYQAVGLAALRVGRWLGREEAANEVAPKLWVGRRPFADEVDGLRAAGVSAVLSLCAELPPTSWPDGPDTPALDLPMLDGTVPSPSELATAASWVADRRAEGRAVLIHCAQGHGRSATVAAVALVELGLAADGTDALARIRSARPGARPSRAQCLAAARYRPTSRHASGPAPSD